MSFNDYYAVMPNLPSWPLNIYKWGVIIAAAALGIGVLATIALLSPPCWRSVLPWLRDAVWLSLAGGAALILVVLVAYMSVMAAGKKPFRPRRIPTSRACSSRCTSSGRSRAS